MDLQELNRVIKVRKRHFLRHLYIKCIILPRQAQDKHRENSKKNGVFSQALRKSTGDSDLPYMTSEQFAEVDADGSGAASETTEDEQEGKKAAHVLARNAKWRAELTATSLRTVG